MFHNSLAAVTILSQISPVYTSSKMYFKVEFEMYVWESLIVLQANMSVRRTEARRPLAVSLDEM
jgi:hypothetical protein